MANINLNREPYFDDYDENKKFHRILFRPGFAVQTRELNQLQTILQNQVARFGEQTLRPKTLPLTPVRVQSYRSIAVFTLSTRSS